MAIKTLDINWALTTFLPPLNFVLPGLLPETFGLLVAPGATGKSTLALDVAVSIALGRPAAEGLFPSTKPGKVVYVAAEENERILAERIRSMLDLEERATQSLRENLIIAPLAGEPCALLRQGQETAFMKDLHAVCAGARLIIIDPLRRMHDGEENDSAHMTQLVMAMERLAKASGAAVVGIHHANRALTTEGSSQHAARGSSALVDGARWQVNLTRMDERTAEQHGIAAKDRGHYVAIDYAKTNYLSPQPKRWLKRNPSGRLILVELPDQKTKGKGLLAGARVL